MRFGPPGGVAQELHRSDDMIYSLNCSLLQESVQLYIDEQVHRCAGFVDTTD